MSGFRNQGNDLVEDFVSFSELGIDPGGANQALFAFGRNNNGQLGLGNISGISSPNMVGRSYEWKKIKSSGYISLAIKTDGTLWAWGENQFNGGGGLGLGDTTNRSSPTQVGNLTNWETSSSNNYNSSAIKTDGTLWSWGSNQNGQLGLGNITNRSSPVQVGTLTNWKQVTVGRYHTLAVKTDGTLWSWGKNSYGQLGLGNLAYTSSPVQVGTLSDWKCLNSSGGAIHSMAIKTDGTLWSWGSGQQGQLGLGDTTNRSSPTQVGTLSNWKIVSGRNSSGGIKTDGTLWSWGNNSNGQLGLGDTTLRNSPVQVGSLNDWKDLSITSNSSAIKTDGTLWSWGNNSNGQLGLGDVTSRSSPTQVGSLTNWKIIGAGYSSMFAMSSLL